MLTWLTFLPLLGALVVALLPTRRPGVLRAFALSWTTLVAALGGPGVELLIYPGQGLVYAGFEAGGTDARAAADSAWSRVRSAAEAVEGGLRLESAPLWAKAERDVFGDSGGSRKILEALKNRFDPDRILNPGRFAGAI